MCGIRVYFAVGCGGEQYDSSYEILNNGVFHVSLPWCVIACDRFTLLHYLRLDRDVVFEGLFTLYDSVNYLVL